MSRDGRGQARSRRFPALAGLLALLLTVPVAVGLHSATESGAVPLQDWLPAEQLGAEPPQHSIVLAADGSELAAFSREDRVTVSLDEVAPVLRDAVLATEDSRFYDHGAVDPIGMLRAATKNLAAGGVEEGGSTLTQQYVKQALVQQSKNREQRREATETTLSRKLREMTGALAVEGRLDKDEILTRYLNLVYFGNGAYGVEVAAQRYFSKSAAEVTLPEAALLAGVISAPGAFDPVQEPDAALGRRNEVLARMAATGVVDAAAARRARSTPLDLSTSAPRRGCDDATHPFFCSYVLSEIRTLESLGATPQEREDRLLAGGLTIRTTLDPKAQTAATDAVRRHIGNDHPVGAAAVLVQPGSGAVRSIAANRDYGEGEGATTVNHAVDADQGGSNGFQAGSTFKPFVLAAAAEKGIDRDLDLQAPSEVTVDGFEMCDDDDRFPPYDVQNYEDEGFGRIDLAEATALSVNTFFVQLAERVGTCKPPELAERMGLRRADGKLLSRVPSFVLGVDEVSPLRMAEAYATLAAGGRHCSSHAISSVTTQSGDDLEVPEPGCERVLAEKDVRMVTDLLDGVIDGDNPDRTGRKMSLDSRPAAGKTGTTNDASAVWFAGYTPDLAGAVWAGYPDASKPLKDLTIRGKKYDTLFGGALPGPIWRDAMNGALAGEEATPLE